MEAAVQITKRLYQHSFVRYVVIGGTTVGLDFGLLVLLHGALNVNLIVAITLAYGTSIIFNFTANRLWAFGATQQSVARHLGPYLLLLGFNYLFTVGFVAGTTNLGLHYTIAKLLAVGIQISWTYIAYKKLIFRQDA
jgi:putative flippase GtrA